MLERLGDGPVGLGESPFGGLRHVGQRAGQRVHQEARAPRARAGTSPPHSRRRPPRRRWARTRPGAPSPRRRRSRPARARSPRPAAASAGRRAPGRARPAGARVEQRQLMAEQVVGGRVGLGESNRRSTASQACVARSSEARLPRSAGWACTVSTWLTVQSSPRPSCSTSRTRLSGSSRPPSRERTRRTPLATAPTRPRSACRDAARDPPRRSGSSAAPLLRS